MRVVDASVVVTALLDSNRHGPWALDALQALPIAAPELVLVEVTNVLRRLEVAGRISTETAAFAQQDLLDLPLDLYPYPPFADRVWSLRANLTAYDAWYVAVAETFDAELVTLDARLFRAPGPTCRFRPLPT